VESKGNPLGDDGNTYQRWRVFFISKSSLQINIPFVILKITNFRQPFPLAYLKNVEKKILLIKK
jgi:hypothetical protein